MHPPNPLAIKRNPANSWAGVMFGLWTGGIYAAVIAGKLLVKSATEEGTLQIAALVVAILWPLGYFPFSRHGFFPNRIKGGTFLALAVFFLFSVLSAFFSPAEIHSLAFVGLTLVSLWIALQFVSCLDGPRFETGLKIYAFIITAVLLGFAAYDYVPGVRLGGGKNLLNPNAVGVVCISAALSAMAIRRWLIRYTLIVVVFAIIYLTGSRTAAISTLLGLMVIAYERTRAGRGGIKLLVMFGAVLALVAMIYAWDRLAPAVEGFMQLHSSHRGIASGASGRTIVWGQTWRLFLDNPVFGIGFRAHEYILGVSAHNGYLATLAEIGLFGFSAIIYLIISGTYRLWRRARQPEWAYSHSVLFGLCAGYLFLAIFERFLVNVGNPTSLLFLVAILSPVLKDKKRPAKPMAPISPIPVLGFKSQGG